MIFSQPSSDISHKSLLWEVPVLHPGGRIILTSKDKRMPRRIRKISFNKFHPVFFITSSSLTFLYKLGIKILKVCFYRNLEF